MKARKCTQRILGLESELSDMWWLENTLKRKQIGSESALFDM